MTWELPPGQRSAQLHNGEADGPGGLRYRLEQRWDEAHSELTSTLSKREPYVLPASAYPEVRQLFSDLQRASRLPVLIGPRR